MSVRVEAMRLTCNHPGCAQSIKGYQSARTIRRIAADHFGWSSTFTWTEHPLTRDGWIDLCRDHSAVAI